MLFACILITIQAILQQATPITLRYVVDELSKQITSGTGNYGRLLTLFLFILIINIIGVVLSSLNQRLGDFIASRLGKNITGIFYKKIFTLPQTYFDSEISGKIVNQLNRGILSIRDFINAAANFIMPALLQAVFSIGVLMYFDRTIGLLALLIFPVYIAISGYSTKKWGQVQQEKNVYEDWIRGRIQEVIGNIKLVKTYNTQVSEWNSVSEKYKVINRLFDKQSTEYHILNFLREFGLEAILIAILFLIFKKTFLGQLTLGEMVLIIQLLNQLRQPLFAMSFILERIQQANADSKAFFDVMELKSTETFNAKNLKAKVRYANIEFKNVNFSYEDGAEVLKDINLKVSNKEIIALVGHSGAGKTTLVNLILKLYEPTHGKIFLSGKDYKKTDHTWIRSHMALVFQDAELFSSTIRENVSYGMERIKDERIIKALKQANAYEFISKFKDGLDARIGERGLKLSGGQKQRIQIARAILQDKPVLILDEATSSLDSKSEKLVQDALKKLYVGRLVIIIAHRFSTIQDANRIIVLNKGTIVDAGSPQELARKKGLYSELLKYQIEGNKKLLSEYELH
jgi:ATP-binding cassette, subfamily B, bacterial